MIISFKTDTPLNGWAKSLYEWVILNYAPRSRTPEISLLATGDDLTTVAFFINGKFYGPVRQTLMPKEAWINLSRFMSAAKNSKKDTTKTELYYSSDYNSRCVLVDPQGVLRYQRFTV